MPDQSTQLLWGLAISVAAGAVSILASVTVFILKSQIKSVLTSVQTTAQKAETMAVALAGKADAADMAKLEVQMAKEYTRRIDHNDLCREVDSKVSNGDFAVFATAIERSLGVVRDDMTEMRTDIKGLLKQTGSEQ